MRIGEIEGVIEQRLKCCLGTRKSVFALVRMACWFASGVTGKRRCVGIRFELDNGTTETVARVPLGPGDDGGEGAPDTVGVGAVEVVGAEPNRNESRLKE